MPGGWECRYAQIIECVNQSDAVRYVRGYSFRNLAQYRNVLGTCSCVRIYCDNSGDESVFLLLDREELCRNLVSRISVLYHFHWKEMRRKQFVHWRAVIMQPSSESKCPDSNKGTYGKLLMITGSKGMSGAGISWRTCTYRTSTGSVQIYTLKRIS